MKFKRRKMECPICHEGTMDIDAWYYPATRTEPPDGGFEIYNKTCDCDEEKIQDAVEEERREYNHIENEMLKLEEESQYDQPLPDGVYER